MRQHFALLSIALNLLMIARAQAGDAFGPPPTPADNPTTAAKIQLGRMLFFDTRLSINKKISCNSCHDVTRNGDDGKPRSPGFAGQLGGRNSPTVFNAAYYSVQFWDGRAATLEDQAKGPVVNPVEMGMPNHELVVSRLKEVPGYQKYFDEAFGKGTLITMDNVVKAIAAFERTLVTPNSPYDRFQAGDKLALSTSAQRGLKLVQTVGCMGCHNGPHFSGPVRPLGEGNYQKFPLMPNTEYDKKYKFSADLGRFEVTKKDADKNMFRIPSWRNVAMTAPYFHNGAVAKLDEAIRVMAKTQLNKELKDGEVKDIEAFLKSLTGKFPKEKAPEIP